MAIVVPLDRDSLDCLAALDRMLRHLAGYRILYDQRMTAQQRRHLKAMMGAVDASQHHASQRKIAQALLGVDRIFVAIPSGSQTAPGLHGEGNAGVASDAPAAVPGSLVPAPAKALFVARPASGGAP